MRYILKDLLIDTEARTVRRGHVVVRLSELDFDVLIGLIEAAPEPLSAQGLSDAAWHSTYVSDETIAQRIALLRKALGDDAKKPEYIRTVRGVGYAITGQVERPDRLFRRKVKRVFSRPNLAPLVAAAFTCLVSVGLVYLQRDEAPEITRLATPIATDLNSESYIASARAQLAVHQLVETDRAIDLLRELLGRDPGNRDARLTLSFALSTKATKFDGGLEHKLEAESLARDLIEEQPYHSNAWSALGYALSAQSRLDESLSALLYAYQLDPNNAPAGSSAAYVHFLQGHLYQALALEFRVRDLGGRSRYAELQIAHSLDLAGHPAAETWYSRALSLNPGQVVVVSGVARSHLRHGSPLDALETLDQVRGEDAFSPLILQVRGRANLRLGRLEQAREDFLSAGGAGSYELAALEALSGENATAEDVLASEKMAELDGDPDPAFRVQLAEVASASGQNDLAIRLIAQAINLGWRDARWLRQSPFIGELMRTPSGAILEERMNRELENQRRLIEGDFELMRSIDI